MTDPKTATPANKPAPAAKAKDDDEPVVIPPKSTTATPAASPAKKGAEVDSRTMSSVGAELHPDATTTKVDGKLALDAGGSHPAAAPAPTPAEAVLYPSTGGLPDTGPNSKYVLGDERGPELYNRDGQRVNADGQLIDDLGNILPIPDKGVDDTQAARRVTDKNMMKQAEFVSEQTKAEMEAGKRALAGR